MCTGPAAGQCSKMKMSLQATTEELMAEMEKLLISNVSRRCASEEIHKPRLSASATGRRAAADDLIERLSTFFVSRLPEDQADEVTTNALVHCVHHVPWARPVTTGLNCKAGFDLQDVCNTLSGLATDEDIVKHSNTTPQQFRRRRLFRRVDLHMTNSVSATCSELSQGTQSAEAIH
jgi:hypothetical protein